MVATVLKPLALSSSGPPKPLTALDISASPSTKSTSPEPSSSNTFQRLRSTLETFRSRKAAPREDIRIASPGDFRDKENASQATKNASRDKGQRKILQRPFRRGARESVTPSQAPPSSPHPRDEDERCERGNVPAFQAPSLRQGSVSSPALHLSSRPFPSPRSRPAMPVVLSSSNAALVSPPRDHGKRASGSTSRHEISSPSKLGSRRTSADPPDGVNRNTSSRHRPTRSTPQVTLNSPSTPSLPSKHTASGRPSDRLPPSILQRDLPSLPDTPAQRGILQGSSRAVSASHLPLAGPPSPEPSTPTRGLSPIRARSPTVRPRVASPARIAPNPGSQSSTPRKPYLEPRRTSLDTPRRTSYDIKRGLTESPTGSSGDSPSPSPAPRSASSPSRQYTRDRPLKVTGSLEHRELIRTATSMLCKEMLRPPTHMSKTESGIKDWEEVQMRINGLRRLERVWGKSGANSSATALNTAGEDRERRHFADALRDGFILCHLINKLRSSSVVRPDPREDGVFRSSNVTKFLAACASYGLPNEDLFQPDDLHGVTSETLARVAKTVIALINFVETPLPSRILSGQGKRSAPVPVPYPGSASRATSSTPNLLHISSSPSSPTRKRWSPPSALPPLRSNSSEEGSAENISRILANDDPTEPGGEELMHTQISTSPVPRIKPPPRSALRPRPIKRADISGASASSGAADCSHADESQNLRQSIVSTAMTETTIATVVSSILDNRRSYSGQNKFGTIRTVTTELTSEAPSLTRTEGASISEDMFRRSMEGTSKSRDRKLSETIPIDLARVAEETDESFPLGGDMNKPRNSRDEDKPLPQKPVFAVNLHKGRWPEDFMDVFGKANHTTLESQALALELDDEFLYSSHMSASPQHGLSGSSNRNELAFDPPKAQNLPRIHRPRHSVDNPVLMPRDNAFRRDTNQDGAVAPRAMLRRHSTKPSAGQRDAIYIPQSNDIDDDDAVPFPRATSRERPSGVTTPIGESPSKHERPKFPRGRFQSDVEESLTARRRTRPSADEFLGGPRSRIESMISLGVSSNASASDLWRRESIDGSGVRKTIVVSEDGKPPVQYQLGNCIGRGQFGSVYRTLNLSNGQTVAVKQIRLEGLKEAEVTELMREVNIYKQLSHPGIVRYEGMTRDDETLSIVLEYAENGSLGQTLKAYGKLNERLVASYVAKILEGLHYLHGQDVVHCDLKAANILTTKTGNVKLTDFGVSLNLRAMEAMERGIKNVAGTPNWMAPEIIELKGASAKSDIWSLACTVIELLTGRPPYAEISNSMTVMFRIVEDKMPSIPEECSDLAREFLVQCFNKDPAKRPSAEILFEHPWLKQNWGIHKELRPQDSIPFLRRVSADIQKSEAARYLTQVEIPVSFAPESSTKESPNPQSPLEQRISPSSVLPLGESDISPREHSFVKTTFSKAMHCRICLKDVKRSAVICAQCSLVSHSKCAPSAPPTCDLRAHLLQLAQYAEKGKPTSLYHNPADALGSERVFGPMSDVSYITHSDTSQPSQPTNPAGPSTAFKFISALRRSRSNLRGAAPASASQPQTTLGEDNVAKRKTAGSTRNKGRPLSFTSNSTGMSSLRSAATAAESFSSGPDTRRTYLSSSIVDRSTPHSDRGRLTSRTKPLPVAGAGEGDEPHAKKRDSKTNGNCIIQ